VTFSPQWRETFGRVDPARTEAEVAFIAGVLPLPGFWRVLDVPCGDGRHMAGLVQRGYRVLGIDCEPSVVAEARAAGLDARVGDMRDLAAHGEGFDALVCLWASFGYFDAPTNQAVLGQFAERLRPGGRLVLDVYHREFFEAHQGEIDNRGVRERKTVHAGRLRAELRYADGSRDVFEWQLFTPDELTAAAAAHGLTCILACRAFDETLPPSPIEPRLQVVLERRRGGSLRRSHP
jgi:SAM-dependent methyltransferase